VTTFPEGRAHNVVSFGRRFPDAKVKARIAKLRPIAHYLPHPEGVPLPANFSLKDQGLTPPIHDQSQEPCCTGEGVRDLKGSQERQSGTWDEDFSVQFAYTSAKQWGGYLNQDGAYMIDVYDALKARGVCREHYRPFTDTGQDQYTWPSANPDADVDAMNWGILDFADVMVDADGSPAKDPVGNIMQAIFQLNTMVNPGTPWTQDWMDAWMSGVMPLPSGALVGGHSWGIYGWKTEADGSITFLCQNSWGETNAMLGYFTCPALSFTSTCTVWIQNGGAECYKAIDAVSHVCPQGQHYDFNVSACVDDGPGPQPTDCYQQDIICEQNAMTQNTDFWGMFMAKLGCFETTMICVFGLGEIRRRINLALGKKLRMTKTKTLSKIGIGISVTITKPKNADW